MRDLIDRQSAIDAIAKLIISIPTADGKDLMDDVNRIRAEDISVIKRLPSAQPDEEKMSDLLYDVYRLACPQLGTGGVAVLKSYISMIYKETFGEEGPRWMKK